MTVPAYPTLAGLYYPILRTPEWDTDVQISISGKRTAFARRAFPRYRYELTYTVLRTAAAQLEFQTLLAFYNMVNGRSGLFTYVDSDDGTATTQPFGTGDGATTQFQLVRTLTGTGSYSFVLPVYYIITSTIFKNASPLATPADYTINTTGMVTFTVAPSIADALTWTGTFGFYCRFDDDTLQFEKFLYNMYEVKKVRFSTEVF